MNRLKRAALAEVPHYNRSGFYSQVVLVLACAFYFQWYPVVPTAAISVLGVVAAFMTIRALKPDNFSRGEQIVYILIAFVLFATEMKSVYRGLTSTIKNKPTSGRWKIRLEKKSTMRLGI